MAEDVGEGEIDLWLYGDLVELLMDHLYGIFNSGNVVPLTDKKAQTGIQGGGLTTAGRTSNQNNAVRHLYELAVLNKIGR